MLLMQGSVGVPAYFVNSEITQTSVTVTDSIMHRSSSTRRNTGSYIITTSLLRNYLLVMTYILVKVFKQFAADTSLAVGW